jgi:oxalate decarboxylase/phosphoglucose isomerase-like protein (cupin superfamily)
MAKSKSKIQFIELPNHGDARGFSFTVPAEALKALGRVADVHLASIKPGAVRGNHYHKKGRMGIVVLPGAKWSFHWDEGEGAEPRHRVFDGSRAVLVLVAVGSSHAVSNDDKGLLWMATISSEKYSAADRVARKVV